MATNTFFDEDSHENAIMRERESVQETGEGPGQDELVPATEDPINAHPPPPSAPVSSNQRRTGYCATVTSNARINIH